MPKKNIAIILEFGFHEIKKYIHSGFANELSKSFNITWFALNKGCELFDQYFKNTGFPIVYFDTNDFAQSPTRLEKINQKVRRNWLIKEELGAFHNHTIVTNSTWKTTLIGNSLSKKILETRTISHVYKNYFNEKLAQSMKEHEITHLLTTGYSSSFAKSMVITAQRSGIDVFYVVNSWKDLYIDNFIPFKKIKGIFVWSNEMKEDYLKHMPYLAKENFIVSGNPTFDILLNESTNKSKEYYATKYSISPSAKWLLYTMMPVGLVPDEIDTILLTAKKVSSDLMNDDYVILVRKNPTHTQYEFDDIKLPENVRIVEHYCSYDKKSDMIIQTKEGEEEWVDLLNYCDVNLSVPSTVALEFLLLHKPVLNIAYNSKEELDPRVNQFFDAGFYRPLLNGGQVLKISNPAELIEFLKKNRTKTPENSKRNNRSAASIIVESIAV